MEIKGLAYSSFHILSSSFCYPSLSCDWDEALIFLNLQIQLTNSYLGLFEQEERKYVHSRDTKNYEIYYFARYLNVLFQKVMCSESCIENQNLSAHSE